MTFDIRLALADGERHGYAIMQDVAARTDGAVRLGPGTLCASLTRLLEAGLVTEAAERAEARRLDALVRAARSKPLLGLDGLEPA